MCMSPQEVFWNYTENKWQYVYDPKNCHGRKTMIIPCGKCPECRAKWRTQLAQRVRWECLKYSFNERCFLTLTISNEKMQDVCPNYSLDHAYFQKFIKRLRRYLEYHGFKGKIKYFMCGEYGTHNSCRPHFHVLLFGWKPQDLRYKGMSAKHHPVYTSALISKLWGAGRIEVGDVTEHTAPYMTKYMVKYSEVKQHDWQLEEVLNEETGEIIEVMVDKGFTNLGKNVRKPYIVYPKKILGLEYFLENYQQILKNGFILDSRGKKHGIPKCFIKWIEKSIDIGSISSDLLKCYEDYINRVDLYIFEQDEMLKRLGIRFSYDKLMYYREQGAIKREIYESFKNKNR